MQIRRNSRIARVPPRRVLPRTTENPRRSAVWLSHSASRCWLTSIVIGQCDQWPTARRKILVPKDVDARFEVLALAWVDRTVIIGDLNIEQFDRATQHPCAADATPALIPRYFAKFSVDGHWLMGRLGSQYLARPIEENRRTTSASAPLVARVARRYPEREFEPMPSLMRLTAQLGSTNCHQKRSAKVAQPTRPESLC